MGGTAIRSISRMKLYGFDYSGHPIELSCELEDVSAQIATGYRGISISVSGTINDITLFADGDNMPIESEKLDEFLGEFKIV